MIIAVDFDGTLCEEKFPEIGAARTHVIEKLKEKRLQGDKLILWTCRTDELLENAVNWCKGFGLEFDAVNDNLPEIIEAFGHNQRKVAADVYLDDRAELP